MLQVFHAWLQVIDLYKNQMDENHINELTNIKNELLDHVNKDTEKAKCDVDRKNKRLFENYYNRGEDRMLLRLTRVCSIKRW